MIIFDNDSKKLEIPAGLGNLEVVVQDVVDSETVEEIYEAISASTASTFNAAKEYTDEAISGGIVLDNYYTSAQTDNAIATATAGMITNNTSGTSKTITSIWAGTQAEYDLLPSTGATILYIIL